jgi:hypothetical protein
MNIQENNLNELYLMYFVVPLWLTAGIADWLCHRRAHIEKNSGPKESLIHLLMLVEMGIPVLAGLFLQINAGVFAMMIVAFFLHEATALWDVTYATKHRTITPIEQHIHSFLEMLPLMAISIMALLHWSQFAALFRHGSEVADFSIRRKVFSLPSPYVQWLLAAIVVFELLPYMEELARTLRAKNSQRRHGVKRD